MKIKSSLAASIIFAALFSSHGTASSGAGNAPPEGCVESGFRHEDGQVILNPGAGYKEGLFLLHNVSGETFQVTHPVRNPGASAGWASEIGPGRWSAFAAGPGNFALICVKPEAGDMKTLPCEEALKVCGLPNPEMPSDLS